MLVLIIVFYLLILVSKQPRRPVATSNVDDFVPEGEVDTHFFDEEGSDKEEEEEEEEEEDDER